jgi:hypothetical protein
LIEIEQEKAKGDRKLGFRQGFLVRDPDGHVLRIIEK